MCGLESRERNTALEWTSKRGTPGKGKETINRESTSLGGFIRGAWGMAASLKGEPKHR